MAPALPAAPSDAPARTPGLRTRSGNAMHHTRAALLEAAEQCVERAGVRRTTMGDVAVTAAVAKATLYNHFRTKDDLLAALVRTRVEELAVTCREAASSGLAPVLVVAARQVSGSAALRRVVADEPALAAGVAAGDDVRAWQTAKDGVRAVLSATGSDDGDDAVELVLRWLASHVLRPAADEGATAQAARLVVAVAAANG